MLMWLFHCSALARSMVYLTSSAVIGCPSLHFIPLRILYVHVRPLLLLFQLSAIAGWAEKSFAAMSVRNGQMRFQTSKSMTRPPTVTLSESTFCSWPTVKVTFLSPDAAAVAGTVVTPPINSTANNNRRIRPPLSTVAFEYVTACGTDIPPGLGSEIDDARRR